MDGRRGKFLAGLVDNLLLYAEYRLTGRAEEATDEANAPFLIYIWHWFLDLSGTRDAGQGFAPIKYREIAAWSALKGIPLRPFELRAIRRIDSVAQQLATPSNTVDAGPDEMGDLIGAFRQRVRKT